MGSNKYALAGWLAITQAILFPLIFLVGLIETGVAAGLLDIRKPFFGPSDALMVLFTVIAIYTLLMFKKLLNEHYECHDLDLLIYISIWWAIMFEVVGIGLMLVASAMWPVDEALFAIVYIIFFASAMITIGIVDILIAVKLLKIKEHLGEYIRGFAYITMAAGICEVSVLFSPLSMLMIPVVAIILALIFFKDKQKVEYV